MNNKYLAYVLAALTIGLFIKFVIDQQPSTIEYKVYLEYSDFIKEGFFNTLKVSFISLSGSLVLGFILYLFSISKIRYFNALADLITEIIYGTPLLVLIVVGAFVIGPSFGVYSRLQSGVAAIIIYMTPYMTNVYKSAFSTISKEQYMAMDLFGFTPYQKYRYIIFPQVIRVIMPPMMNNFSLIIKGSALLNVLSYNELYYSINIVQSRTFAFVGGYLILWIIYLVITIPLSQLTKVIERKWAL